MNDDLYGVTIDSYTIHGRIGIGGMGSVYAATDAAGERYALKIMHEDLAQQPDLRERFLREAQLMQVVRHPNIVPLLDFGIYGERLYLVMPFIDGGTLQMLLRSFRFSPSLAWVIFDPLTQALHHAHVQGIVHRDLKPGNVLIARADDHVYLSDFGLSKRPDMDTTLTATGTSIGTPTYMSPEAALAEEVDLRSDIYSLGIMLFELLFDDVPFKGVDDAALVYAHLYQPVPLPPDTPPAMANIILRCLAKERQDRYPSVRHLRDDYLDALEQLGDAAEQVYGG